MNGSPIYNDMAWEPEKVAVEYDSDISHLSSAQHSKDKQRASALAASGYKVISITRNNVKNLTELDKTFKVLRKVLGMPRLDHRLVKYRSKRKAVLSSFQNFRSYEISTYEQNRRKTDKHTVGSKGVDIVGSDKDEQSGDSGAICLSPACDR